MSKWLLYIETFFLGCMALLLLIMTIFELHIPLLRATEAYKNWRFTLTTMRVMLGIYGTLLVILTFTSMLFIRRGRSLTKETLDFIGFLKIEIVKTTKWVYYRAQLESSGKVLLMLLIAGIGIRCFFLSQPIRYDEADTFFNFATRDIYHLFHYTRPNNHVLHTLLVRLSTLFFGNSVVAIRIPAFIAGILTIPMTFIVARLFTGKTTSGFIACTLVAIYPYLILYNTLARGYSLVILLSLMMAVLMYRLAEHPNKIQCFLISLITATGLLVIPVFVYPAAGLWLWGIGMLLLRRQPLSRILRDVIYPSFFMTFALTVFMYTPTIIASNGTELITSNIFVTPLGRDEFQAALGKHFQDITTIFAQGIHPAGVLSFLILTTTGMVFLILKRHWYSVILLPTLFLALSFLLLTSRAVPFPRIWTYLFPFLFILCDTGITCITEKGRRFLPLLACGVAFIASLHFMSTQVTEKYREGGYFPEAPALVDILHKEIKPGERVYALTPANLPLHYYWWQRGTPHEAEPAKEEPFLREFFIVKVNHYDLEDFDMSHNAEPYFSLGNARVYVD